MTKNAFVSLAILLVITGCGDRNTNAPTTAQQVTEFRGHPPTAEQMAKVRSMGPPSAPGAGTHTP